MFHIIYNPVSGRKHSKKWIAKEKEAFKFLDENKIEYIKYDSLYQGAPLDIAKKITSENESGDIIVWGGDGTLNEVIRGINDLSKWNIGIVAMGSGNDLATCLKIPVKSPVEALKLIVEKNLKPIDYIKVNDYICANICGTGIDIEIIERFEKHTKLKGSFRYVVSLVEALTHVRWHEFDVSLDDGKFNHKEGFIITLCNGEAFGGGITICPGANPEDHQLEFVCVNKLNKIKIPLYLIKLLNKKVFTFKETEHYYCKKAVFKSDKELVIQIDGNVIRNTKEFKCEIVNNGIQLYR